MATKTKKFKLFDTNRDGKGVYDEENRKPTLGFFFKLLWRKLSQLVRLNVLLFAQVIPVLVFLYVYFLGVKTPTATEVLYAPLYGISKISGSASLTALLDMNAIQMGIPIFSPVIIIILIALAVIFALSYGWINVGAAYVVRGLFRGDPVFVFSDFFYAIKRNFKQAFWFGLLDFICTVVLVVDFLHFYSRTGSYGNDVMYFMIVAVAIIYIVMRFYIVVYKATELHSRLFQAVDLVLDCLQFAKRLCSFVLGQYAVRVQHLRSEAIKVFAQGFFSFFHFKYPFQRYFCLQAYCRPILCLYCTTKVEKCQ